MINNSSYLPHQLLKKRADLQSIYNRTLTVKRFTVTALLNPVYAVEFDVLTLIFFLRDGDIC